MQNHLYLLFRLMAIAVILPSGRDESFRIIQFNRYFFVQNYMC